MSTVQDTSKLNIAVDVGRSSVKVAYDGVCSQFPFHIANRKSATADMMFDRKPMWAMVDGQERIFGDDALILGESVFDISEGPAFFNASIHATVFAIANAMRETGNRVSLVNLAINLTFDNYFRKEDYKTELKTNHTVVWKDGYEVSFVINSVFVMYQGFAGLFGIVANDEGKISKSYMESEGIVIDIGRQTIDLLHVNGMVVKSGLSKDFGTSVVFNKASNLLRERYGIMKSATDIEDHLRNKKPFSDLQGNKVTVQDVLGDSVEYYAPDIDAVFQGFLSKSTPDYLILLGGGALIYGPHFKAKYPVVMIPEDPQFSNAQGLLKLINRASK